VKVGLCLFLVRFQGSDEDGAEIGGRCSCGGSLRHSNATVTARNSDEMFQVGGERGRKSADGRKGIARGSLRLAGM
jgi:hypothetical protein